ncbi:protein LTV1 homolog [Eucalyptus grandis]|uniref:protein LTV1 homolog n=1 Tax=Eucalyptus grandis TaxID=71139 RepID=UPI00192F1033|nr:protein LTV1 homolog [Eucalyptus grandis]
MGRKSKKFIDKKKAATFQLMSRDSADDPGFGDAPGGDRIFVRVDNNPCSVDTLEDDGGGGGGDDDVFADAPGDFDDGEDGAVSASASASGSGLPEHVRREILELGFPDDGYNYLGHLREIRNAGGGSAFYQNPKARLDLVPKDVKAYDASRIQVPKVEGNPHNESIYSVAANSVNVRVQKAVDPEVNALLDDSDLSRFGSDVEDLEEDFVVQANHPEGEDSIVGGNSQCPRMPAAMGSVINGLDTAAGRERQIDNGFPHEIRSRFVERNDKFDDEKPRERRPLDEQFDLLECQEYGSEDDDNDDGYGGYMAEEDESLALKLKQAFDDKVVDDLEIDDKYRVPADLLKDNDVKSKQLQDSAADLIRRCVEYADKYENENDDKEVVIVEESSDESEVWDCESIVSTYSNLDNHPGKIEAPMGARKKKLASTISVALGAANPLISLKGKEKLPVDYLPRGMKSSAEKVKGGSVSRNEQPRRKQHGQESKEEKKERKAAVKEERREARRMKKETKELYRCEAQQAQKVAATTGPSSIPLM